jgi:hypothetical protein
LQELTSLNDVDDVAELVHWQKRAGIALAQAMVAWINEEREAFQAEATEHTQVFCDPVSTVNSGRVLYVEDGTLNLIGFDQG